MEMLSFSFRRGLLLQRARQLHRGGVPSRLRGVALDAADPAARLSGDPTDSV
jgi:hypothetical protein